MAEKLSLRTNANGDIYVYIEDTSGASLAFGADSANGVVALNTLATPNVEPLESTANMTIDPTANGDILFRPHGTGKSEFKTGNVQITEKNLLLPHTTNNGADGCIYTYQPFFGSYVRYISFPDDFNVYIGSEVGTFPNPTSCSYNIAIGAEFTFDSVTALGANNNIAMGRQVLDDFTTGNNNISIGSVSMSQLISGSNNIGLGGGSLGSLLTGSNNIAIKGGGNYTGAESANICIFNDGVAAESATIRIGTGGTQTRSFMAGIVGATNAGASTVPYIETATGQLATVPGGAVLMNTGTQSLSISSDASATTVAIATGAAVKGLTLGSTNSTSASTLQSGSGALAITSTNGTMTINSGTGALSISSDASATTVNLATGAAAKVVTLGSTTTTSSLALKYGTADFTLASATGTVMNALDTGEITYPLQPAFFAHLASAANNVTGAGAVYTLGTAALTIVFDQNGDMNTNGTFTAPVTGRYNFSGQVLMIGCTIATTGNLRNNTSNRVYFGQFARAAGAQNMLVLNTTITDMDAGDTTTLSIQVTGEAGSTVDMSSGSGGGPDCWLSGFLVC